MNEKGEQMQLEVENSTKTTEHTETESIQTKENTQDEQLRELMQKVTLLEKESEEKNELLKKLESQSTSQTLSSQEELGDDDFVEGRQLKSVKAQQEAIAKKQQELEEQIRVEKIYARYKDIDDVVTKENLSKLKQLEPEVHAGLAHPDPFITWVNAYKHIKTYVKKETQTDVMAERIQTNQEKAPSIQKASHGKRNQEDSMFSQPLTKELKNELIARRRANIKRAV
jgi:hypothetical protein